MIALKIFSSRSEAELAKSILELKDIWAIVVADDKGRMSLMVQPEDLEDAMKVFQVLEDEAIPPDA